VGYKIMETQERINEIKETIKSLENGDNTQEYDDFLNDTTPSYKIGYLEFDASSVLKNCDEVAYRCGLADYNDAQITELENEIEELETELKDEQDADEVKDD